MTQRKGDMSRAQLYATIETRILHLMHEIVAQPLDDGPHSNPLGDLSTLAYVLETVAAASATRIARTQEN